MSILHIMSSPMGEKSVSRSISAMIIDAIRNKKPSATIKELDLAKEPIDHLDSKTIAEFYSPSDSNSKYNYANDALEAKLIIIDAPMWNLSIPSVLKAWIDHIVRVNVTFKYGENGPNGLIPNDHELIIVSSRGGVYSEGPAASFDFQEKYLTTIFGWLGIKKINVIRVEGAGSKTFDLAKVKIEKQKEIDILVNSLNI